MYESYINKIEDVGKLRNLKPKTITLYQKNVSRFLNYIKKNPEELTCEDARNYLLYLQGKGDKASTLNNNNGSLVFFYKRVLGKLWDDNLVPRAINDYAVPEVLSFHDVEKLLNATDDLKYKAILQSCIPLAYGFQKYYICTMKIFQEKICRFIYGTLKLIPLVMHYCPRELSIFLLNIGSLAENLPEFFFPTNGLVNISQLPAQDLFSKSL